MLFIGKFRSNVCVLFLSKNFLCVFISSYTFWPTLKQGWVLVLNHITDPAIKTINHFIKAVRYVVFCNFLGTQTSLNIIFRHLVRTKRRRGLNMWRQKRKSIHELKWSAGLPIEADESVLMWEEWKGRRSEKHKCCIYSRFPNSTFSQLGNLRSRQRMTLRTNRAKHFTTHTSPLICLYHLIGSPFPNIYHYLTPPYHPNMKC